MDRARFQEYLDLIRGEIIHAMIAYRVGKGIRTDNQERLDAINRFYVFFGSVEATARVSVHLSLSKIFDSDKRTVNVWNILKHAEEMPLVLVPYLPPQSLADIRLVLKQNRPLINRIKRARNSTIAHREIKAFLYPAAEETGATFGELEQALALAEYVHEKLSRGFDGVPTVYGVVEADAIHQTESIIRLVMNHETADSV